MRPYDGRPLLVRFRFPIRIALSVAFASFAIGFWPHLTATVKAALAGPHHVPTSTYLVYDGDGHTHLLRRPGARITPSGIDLMTSVEYGVSGDPSRPLPLSDVARLIRLCTPTMYQHDEMCQRAAISAPTDIMQTNLSLVRSAMIARLPSAYWYSRQDAVRSYLLEECASHWWAHRDALIHPADRRGAVSRYYIQSADLVDPSLRIAYGYDAVEDVFFCAVYDKDEDGKLLLYCDDLREPGDLEGALRKYAIVRPFKVLELTREREQIKKTHQELLRFLNETG